MLNTKCTSVLSISPGRISQVRDGGSLPGGHGLGVEVIVTHSCLCNPVGVDLPSRSDALDTKTGLRSQGAF